MTRPSLHLRLALAGAVAVVVALAFTSAALTTLFAAHVQRRAEAELSVQLDQVVAGLGRDAQGALGLETPPTDPRFEQPLSGLYWQVDTGTAVLRSRSLWDYVLPLPPDELPDGQIHTHILPDPSDGALLTLERIVTLPDRLGGGVSRVAVALTTADLEEARRAFLRDLLPYNAILAAALIAAGWAQLFIGLRPLATIGERVAAVRSGKQNRMGEDFPKEVAPLVAEVDALIAAREDELDRARRRAADLAHGFKTPLQALLGEADRLRESGQDGAAHSIEEIAAAMSRHVDRELTRTRLAGRSRAAKTRVGPVIERVVSVVSRTPQGAELSWQIDANGAPLAAIDSDDLTEALGAIVENASRHAKSHVTIRARDLGAQIEIAVEDDGPGIEPSRIDEMRKRGARADQGGHGLGLSISAEIAEAVGGALELENIAPGLRVRLLLPAVLG
ncbi:hypothetical protein BMI90_12255 [Thioclava sp. L04-15]|uniref:sensor histidine kinase n=1 Tax=Thioclava sp. L04-15 TaxID=1915318 RepID=UPI000997B413|nr:HAMP domain-containing sensor histidine kinase [Thioclava sp. L04-15]OOY27382.1 hypothetical protein BMI90_12255 [Thioclava sp. L04-15]TNE94038.1 MAG: HAMP domain-containing histidine kinase [Paracoccaceae bacterium]